MRALIRAHSLLFETMISPHSLLLGTPKEISIAKGWFSSLRNGGSLYKNRMKRGVVRHKTDRAARRLSDLSALAGHWHRFVTNQIYT